MLLTIGDWLFRVNWKLRQRIPNVKGINSRVLGTDKHVLFIDWDHAGLDNFKQKLSRARKDFDIGDVHIFRTGNGWHAICPGLFTFGEVIDIHRALDPDKLRLYDLKSVVRGTWTLRISPKPDSPAPRYVCTLHRVSQRLTSVGHAAFLEKFHGIPAPPLGYGDSEIEIVNYTTVFKGKSRPFDASRTEETTRAIRAEEAAAV
jgi:hypothetical protein